MGQTSSQEETEFTKLLGLHSNSLKDTMDEFKFQTECKYPTEDTAAFSVWQTHQHLSNSLCPRTRQAV